MHKTTMFMQLEACLYQSITQLRTERCTNHILLNNLMLNNEKYQMPYVKSIDYKPW